ncbi:hypothetical protein CNMCM5793_004849 [Aspergillus hiratsukae]|uniref:Glucose-methanol-choline oxidoreductase C-terminal domain-containing protein n=1 Tax=Aspergillus hiratsukae TaxID=1194566 RepID=A0A8H6NZT5_9EURO|nr:hypothetical protein CNMCM5793_004849 [Aspergillus hiratsukae]
MADQPKDGYQYASIMGTLVAPTSRGSVTIASGNISEPPLINPNWLATETDQKMAVAIFKRVREAFQSPAMAPVVIGEEYFPGPGVQTDEEILDFIRDNVMTIFHPACTCKMGVESDPMAVVDNQGRVFGTDGLRVIDASAFPILPPGHPQATVCSALASPGHHSFNNSTIPSHHSSTYTLLSTGGAGGGKPIHTGDNGNGYPQPTTAVVPGRPSGSVSTITEIVTKTTFKPCSTRIHTQSGTTYYSTWLTTSTYETTSCYTTHVPPATRPLTTTVNVGAANSCPPPSTVTVTVAVSGGRSGNTATHTQAPAPNGGSGSGPGPCKHCETITYTNPYGYTTTIVIPPISEPTNTATTRSTDVGTTTKPTLPVGTGTGTAPSHSHSHTRGSLSGTGTPTETKTWHLERRMVWV